MIEKRKKWYSEKLTEAQIHALFKLPIEVKYTRNGSRCVQLRTQNYYSYENLGIIKGIKANTLEILARRELAVKLPQGRDTYIFVRMPQERIDVPLSDISIGD